MKPLLALALTLLLAACASTSQPTPAPPVSAPVQPPVAWQAAGSTSYESQRPGLGVSYRYVAPAVSGWIDVYVYGLRRADWQSGVGDPQFAAHFQSTIAEVRMAAQAGAYSDLQVGPVRDVVVSGQPFRSVGYRYLRRGEAIASATYLTARNGQLLKYRVSIPAASGRDVDALARRFIEDNLRVDPSIRKA